MSLMQDKITIQHTGMVSTNDAKGVTHCVNINEKGSWRILQRLPLCIIRNEWTITIKIKNAKSPSREHKKGLNDNITGCVLPCQAFCMIPIKILPKYYHI